MTSAYQFWTDSLAWLAGPQTTPRPAIINEYPQAGFYRMKRSKAWVPVAVWPAASGSLGFKFGHEVVGEQIGIEQWPYYAANPITEEIYRAVAERGEHWPDADPTVAAILAAPAAPKVADADPVDEIREQITAALAGVAAYSKIEGEASNVKSAGLRNLLLKLSGEADKGGKALYEPHYRKYKEIYDKWNPLVKLAADGALKIRRAQEKYQDDKREAARIAQQRAEAEQRRLEQEARDAAIQAQIDGRPSPEPVTIAPVVAESNMAAPDIQIRPTFGRASAVRTFELVTAIDAGKVFEHFKTHPDVVGLLTKLAQAALNAGIDVPGVTHETRTQIK